MEIAIFLYTDVDKKYFVVSNAIYFKYSFNNAKVKF